MKNRRWSRSHGARGRVAALMTALLVATLALPTSATAAATWTPQTSGSTAWFHDVDMVSATEGWAVGSNGTIQHYSGGTWTAQTSGTAYHLFGVCMVSATEGWAVGQNGTIRHYSGGAWSAQASGTGVTIRDVDMVSATEGWAVTDGGGILHYSGGTWSWQTSGTTQSLWGVDMISATEGWAVSQGGTILHYSSGTWSSQPSGTTDILTDVSMASATEGWAVGNAGMILHYSGGTWSPQTSGVTSVLTDVEMVSATDGWASGWEGTILRYSNGNWYQQTSGTWVDVDAVSMVNAREGWAVGLEGTILHYTDPLPTGGGSVSISALAPAPEAILTFSIDAMTAPPGGTVTPSTVGFGTLEHGVPKIGSQVLTVSTNAASGYQVTASENGPLASGSNTIADVVGDYGDITEAHASAWSQPDTYGFGYTLSNVNGSDAAFTTNFKQFADASASETAQEVMGAAGPVDMSMVAVEYAVNIGPSQAQGSYANVVTYVCTGNF